MKSVVDVTLDELCGMLSVEHDGTITWDELQGLKDKYFRAEAVAIEVYPPNSHIVNSLPMRHLWKIGAGEYWPDVTDQRQIGDLTFRDHEMLTRTDMEFLHQRDIEMKIKQFRDEYESRKTSLKKGTRRSNHRFKL